MDSKFLIKNVKGLTALDSRGNPTVKAIVETEFGRGVALSPSGASKGKREAVDLRDGGERWLGKGVEKAISNINTIIRRAFIGADVRKQVYLDTLLLTLDGTENKSKLGGNTTTAVSMATAKAAANSIGIPLYSYLGGPQARLLPAPMLNIINGGVHAGNKLEIQEFMIVPVGADRFIEALRMAVEIYGTLKSVLKEKYGKSAVNVGDEGGFAPPFTETREALDAIIEAVKRAGYEPGSDIFIALDAAASQFYYASDKTYRLDGVVFDSGALIDFYGDLIDEYPIMSIEDPFDEDDWEGFKEFTKKFGTRILIVGDDLYTTNLSILEEALSEKLTNAVLVKVNQIGTVTEAIDFTYTAMRHGLKAIISHRSGETEDPFISDFTVAMGTGFIKTGAPSRGERTIKYNRLIEIEEELDPIGVYNNKLPLL